MIAVEVHLNGQRLCVAGADDLRVLHASVTVAGKLGANTVLREGSETKDPPTPTLFIEGVAAREGNQEAETLQWRPQASVSIGDVVELRLVDVAHDAADAPDQRRERRTIPERERRMFEVAKANYLALRDKYEGPSTDDRNSI